LIFDDAPLPWRVFFVAGDANAAKPVAAKSQQCLNFLRDESRLGLRTF